MSKRKLLNDVTIAEMKRLRDEEDLTNAEVAQRLDVSAVTVWKHLGPKGRKRCAQPDASTVKAFPSGKIWDAAHSLTRLDAGWRRYEMDVYAQTVHLSVPDRMPALTAEDIHRMINELTYIEQVLKKWRDDHK